MPIVYLRDVNKKMLRGKTALLRADLNVDSRKFSFRLEAVLPTIHLLLKNKVRVVILSHHGRPRGYEKNLSLRPFVSVLEKELRQKVGFLTDFKTPNRGKVFLMENLRFWRDEEKNDASFARRLAKLGDFYVNDAFAVSHRKNASVAAITRYLPSYAGLLLEKEVKNLSGVMKKARRPFTVVLGGGKASDKLGVMKYFWTKADNFLLGGASANTFFAAQGLPVGNSLYEKEMIPKVRRFLGSKKLVLPIDLKIADKKILDIGPETVKKYSGIIARSKTIIWNGPMGLFEKKAFAEGTKEIWKAILANRKARIVVGGGETSASLRILNTKYQIPKNIFISTGGGAMLEYLSGKKLPGLEALKK